MTVDTDRRRRTAATVVFALALGEAVTTVVAGAASGLGWARLADLFVVTNAIIGLSLAVCGWLIAFHRPRNAVGWSLLAGGCCYGSTATGLTLLAWAGEPTPPWRLLATVTNGGWTWSLALFIPLALVLFPDGRLPGGGWRWLLAVLGFNGIIWTAAGVLDPKGGLTAELGIPGYPAQAGFWQIAWFLAIGQGLILVSFIAALVALVLRYRRASDQVRRQLLWLLQALIVMIGCFTAEGVLGLESLILGVLPILLIPLAITIAVLRHQLLDIRLVVSRSVLYLLLTGGVVAGYLALVAMLEATARRHVSLNSSLAATLVIALAFNPVRVWLQRLLHRAFYGARNDPVRAMAEVGARLGEVGVAAGGGLPGVLEALCQVMRFPAAAIVVDGTQVAVYGEPPAARHAITLRSGDIVVGELLVGLRVGEHRLDTADAKVLTLLAAPLAVAVQAGRLAEGLQVSRERVISGREEERRRIRRDLHDGLGPILTGVVLNADAARLLLNTDRDRSATLLVDLRDQTIAAIEEIRRLVYELRPPALDGMGLIGALREHAAMLTRHDDGAALTVTLDAPQALPDLPAAVEMAVYRIATEALTNVVRHSSATAAEVQLGLSGATLRLSVHDNGTNDVDGVDRWQPGVGLTSIRERTAELGGECEIRHDRTGAWVSVSLPLASASAPAQSEKVSSSSATLGSGVPA
ncbi:sensor histidine kinase [Micromonospora sp. SL4-19]|uniref:sensor histidine kinase n=1 Tax=Micromonospora sp. SL4-19 TaxID=3399129 RepID=UPI003A4E2ECE